MANELVKAERLEIEKVALQAKDAFLAVTDEKVWIREIGFALQILRANAQAFSQCEPASIKDAVTNVALACVTLSPVMQQAFLIPRKVKGIMKCCLDISYRGLVKIATDNSDSIYDIDATCVYANDEFYFEQGLYPIFKHIPCLKDRGEIVAVYAVAKLHHGITKFIVLNRDDIEKARKTSQAPNSPMWTQWYEEGARKTAVKRLYKLLPQSERMAIAVNAVNEHEGLYLAPSKAAEVQERFTAQPVITEDVPVFSQMDSVFDQKRDIDATASAIMDAVQPITEADIEGGEKVNANPLVIGFVENFIKKIGKAPCRITVKSVVLTSFSDTVAKDAQAAIDGGLEVIVEYELKEQGKYKNIKTLKVVAKETVRDWQKEFELAPDSVWLNELWKEFEATNPNGAMIVKMRRINDRKRSEWKEGENDGSDKADIKNF